MLMKLKSIYHFITTVVLLLVSLSVSAATGYTLSSSNITINTAGSYSFSGSGSGAIYLNSSTDNAVYNITLNGINLTAATWASAININNSSSTPVTVNFIVIGSNTTNAYNHGGIQVCSGTANVVFTTTSSGTLTSTAQYAGEYALKNAGGTLNPSIGSGINCTATVGGTVMYEAAALNGAFSNKPLVLTLTKQVAPTISTIAINTFATLATMGGNITNDGGVTVTERGVVYSSTDATPTFGETGVTKNVNALETNIFSKTISGLTANTTYYVRAFATNSVGTSYGDVVTFTTNNLCTWNGTTWSPSIPTTLDDVTLNADYNDAGFNCINLLIAASKQLTIASGTLAVSGNLFLKSDVTGTATIIDNGNITVAGATKVEQYLKTDRNTYMSSPVTSAMSGCILNYANLAMWSFNESMLSWDLISNSVTSFDKMKGYIIASFTIDTTITFTGGSLNTGTQTISGLSRTGNTNAKRGFNLIGNPYPSCVNWKKAVDDKLTSNLESTIWYRSKNGSNYVFDTYNATTNVGTHNYGGTDVTENIPPMQAVWVKVNADNVEGSVTFNNSMRSHPTADNKLKADANTNDIVRLQVANGNNTDETILVFNSNASNAYDAWDSQKMFAESAELPQIYTTVGDEKVVINGLESTTSNSIIPLGFKTATTGTFTISATEINGIDAVVLEDKLLNKTFDLTGSAGYTFMSDNIDNSSRFAIRLKANSVTDVPTVLESTIAISAQNQSIVVTTSETSGTINVYDLLGRIIETKAIEGTKTVLGSTAGVYFVKVQTATNNETTKIIIE